MSRVKRHACKSCRGGTHQKEASPYPAYVVSNPHLQSLFDRIRTGRACRMSEFARFIAPLVHGFEAAAAGVMDEQGKVPKAGIDRLAEVLGRSRIYCEKTIDFWPTDAVIVYCTAA